MRSARPHLLLALVLVGCTERPLGDTASGSTAETTTNPPPASSTAPPGTTAPPPASSTVDPGATDPSPTTNTATTGPLPTTDALTTESPDTESPHTTTTSTTSTTGDPPESWPPAAFIHCYQDAPAGTDISGTSEFGAFVAQRAYFAWWGSIEEPVPVLVFLSPEADPSIELILVEGTTGPIYATQVATDLPVPEGWIGTWQHVGEVRVNSEAVSPQPMGTVTVTELAGNWDALDFDDPPRLVGSINDGAISGSFNAVYCDWITGQVLP